MFRSWSSFGIVWVPEEVTRVYREFHAELWSLAFFLTIVFFWPLDGTGIMLDALSLVHYSEAVIEKKINYWDGLTCFNCFVTDISSRQYISHYLVWRLCLISAGFSLHFWERIAGTSSFLAKYCLWSDCLTCSGELWPSISVTSAGNTETVTCS